MNTKHTDHQFSEELVDKIVSGILEIEQKKAHQQNPQLVHEEILKLLREELKE